MKLDYSKVIMVGKRWATRGESGEFTFFDTAAEAAGEVVSAPADPGFAEWLTGLTEKPKVSEAKDAGFDVSGSDLTDAWAEVSSKD